MQTYLTILAIAGMIVIAGLVIWLVAPGLLTRTFFWWTESKEATTGKEETKGASEKGEKRWKDAA